jgi:hypothetical protein
MTPPIPHIWASKRISRIQDGWFLATQASPIDMKIGTIKGEKNSTHSSHLGLYEDFLYPRWMVSCSSSLTYKHENWNYKRWEQLHPYPIFELSMGFLTSKMTHCFSSLIQKCENWDCKKWDTTDSKPLGSIILSGKSRIIVRL